LLNFPSTYELSKMADNELLADYEDEPEYPTAGAGASAIAGGDETEKKNYAGIHSSGFR
jgi:hypothetical protein